MKKLILGCGALRSICAVGMMTFAVTAEAGIVKEYTLNDSLTATLDDQGVLTIIGSGAMPNWTSFLGRDWASETAKIKSVIAEGVTSVGDYAFASSPLTSVYLPNATTIGHHAFSGSKLTSVYLPNATVIGDNAFVHSSSLISICFPKAATIGEYAFDGCGSLTSVSLPNATIIGECAFINSSSLTFVSLPNATTIGESAFSYCSSLTSVSLQNVATIGDYAFSNCSSLTLVSLPNATTIGNDAFFLCDKIETVILSFGFLANPDRLGWMLRNEAKLVEPFTNDEIKNVTHKVAVFAGGTQIDRQNYEKGCSYYGLTPKAEPQLVQEGEIAVTKESIAAAKAMTVQVVNGQIELGVSVLSNADITASSANWAPVKFTKDTQIGLSADGTKLILPIPVAAQQGFMILQSGDAKVSEGEVRGPVIGEPWYKPTVED